MAKRRRRTEAKTKKRSRSIEMNGEDVTVTGVNVKKVQSTIDAMGNLFWKPEQGDHEIRILPPTPVMEGDFALLQVLHYGFKDESGKIRTVRCLRSMDEACPVCDFIDELVTSKDEDDKKLADDLRASKQLLTPVIVRPSKRVRVFRMPMGVYRIASGFLAASRIGDFTNLKTGQDFLLGKKGEGLRTRYTLSCIGQCKLGVKGWKRQMPDMAKFLAPVLSRKQLKKLIRKTFYE